MSSETAIIGALSLALAVLWGAYMIVRGRSARRMRRHKQAGDHAEQMAEKLLRRLGYRIVEAQPSRELIYRADGAKVKVRVRGDWLVMKGRRRYLVEVKGGEVSAQLKNRSTRRQLLEYGHAFAVDGIVLLDARREKLTSVELPERPKIDAPRSPLLALLGLAIAVVLAYVVLVGRFG